jgi:hypothetical protein
MFSRIVPPNSQVSCRTIPMFDRSSARGIVEMSRPSSVMRPASSS